MVVQHIHTFGPGVKAKVVDDWMHWYINYAQLKKMLDATSKVVSPSVTPNEASHPNSANTWTRPSSWKDMGMNIKSAAPCQASMMPSSSHLGRTANKFLGPGRERSEMSLVDLELSLERDLPSFIHRGHSSIFSSVLHPHVDRASSWELPSMPSIKEPQVGHSSACIGLFLTSVLLIVIKPHVTTTQLFGVYFIQEMKNCNQFFIERQRELLNNVLVVVREMERTHDAVKALPQSKRHALKAEVKKLRHDIQLVYSSLQEEISDLRQFSRVNFDLCVRLLKLFVKKKATMGTYPSFRLWRSVRVYMIQGGGRAVELKHSSLSMTSFSAQDHGIRAGTASFGTVNGVGEQLCPDLYSRFFGLGA